MQFLTRNPVEWAPADGLSGGMGHPPPGHRAIHEDMTAHEGITQPQPRLGSGNWGGGPPLSSCLMGKKRPFADGAGLCSPGRWCPCDRRVAPQEIQLRMAQQVFKKIRSFCESGWVRATCCMNWLVANITPVHLRRKSLKMRRRQSKSHSPQMRSNAAALDLKHVPGGQPFRLRSFCPYQVIQITALFVVETDHLRGACQYEWTEVLQDTKIHQPCFAEKNKGARSDRRARA